MPSPANLRQEASRASIELTDALAIWEAEHNSRCKRNILKTLLNCAHDAAESAHAAHNHALHIATLHKYRKP